MARVGLIRICGIDRAVGLHTPVGQYSYTNGERHGFIAVTHIELGEDVADLVFNRIPREIQYVCNLVVVFTRT